MSQRAADELEHRRGLVLGLTLAEVLLLLLFVLLLALSWRIVTLQREAFQERQAAQALSVRLDSLQGTLSALDPLLAELRAKGGLDLATVKELTLKLGRVSALETEIESLKRDNSKLNSLLGSLRLIGSDLDKLRRIEKELAAAAKINPNDPPEALARAMEILQRLGPETKAEQVPSFSELTANAEQLKAIAPALDAASKINPNDPPEALTRAVEVLSRLGPDTRPEQVAGLDQHASLAAQLDKVRRERDNLMRSGNGLTLPSCWTASDGKTEFMFDVILKDDGLVVRDATPKRANDPAMKLLGSFPRNATINERQFSNATVQVFQFSREHNCRFYSIIRDGTGETNKRRYKQLRTLVEDHFFPSIRPLLAGPTQTPTQEPPASTAVPVGGPFVPPPLRIQGRDD